MTGRWLRGEDCDEDGLVAYMRPMLVFGHNVRPARICDSPSMGTDWDHGDWLQWGICMNGSGDVGTSDSKNEIRTCGSAGRLRKYDERVGTLASKVAQVLESWRREWGLEICAARI